MNGAELMPCNEVYRFLASPGYTKINFHREWDHLSEADRLALCADIRLATSQGSRHDGSDGPLGPAEA